MHHANHFYGHAHILARYARLAEVPRIWGYVQHGWNIHDGYAVGTQFAPGFPKYVWSEAPSRRGWAVGMRNYQVIGSPWAYLLDLERQNRWERDQHPREGTIVYPFHGWEQQNIIGSHNAYADEIRATEDGPVTICLYWNEYRAPEVRRSYEQAGFRVISHGYRGYMWKGTDTDFLNRQLAELRAHRRVVSNRLGTALFYGASVGCEIGVYGDPMILEAERAILGGMERQKRLWPELHQAAVPRDIASELARVELGMDVTLSRPDLIETLGWRHARRAISETLSLDTEGSLAENDPRSADGGKMHPGRLDQLPTDDFVPPVDNDGENP